MTTGHKIEVGDVSYSKLSLVLRFTTACNSEAIKMVEDILDRKDMTMEEVALEMKNLLEYALATAYHRRDLRREKEKKHRG